MRQIFLDTETTGLVHQQGHRIIEIAAVEAINRRLTKNHFHVYLNPEREIDQGAQEIHGSTTEFLQDKPRFVDIVDDFLQFIAGADLIIHNARFDVEFLNAELGRIDKPEIEKVCNSIIDTLQRAKDSRPGQRNSLDALCRHYGIDNSKRVLHGALLDAELLAEVYMAMTRGQESLMMDLLDHGVEVEDSGVAVSSKSLPVIRATSEELAMHDAYLAALEKSGNCLWPK